MVPVSPGLKAEFLEMVSNSQKIPKEKLNFDDLFNLWAKNKFNFYSAFGNKLILRSPEKVTFHLDEQTRLNRVEEFLDWLDTSFIWIEIENADLGALYEFVSYYKDNFFNNCTDCVYTAKIFLHKNTYEAESISIPKGIKIIKAFKYFIKDKNLLYNIQNRASMIIQENKIEGHLCLSIHPLDYLTISENTLGWRSCHALNGDYRAGNLNYMADNSTIVCYLASDAPCTLYGVEWNNKKWRILLFFSHCYNMIFAGRQYPFFATSALDEVKKILPINNGCYWSDWTSGMTSLANVPNGTTTYFEIPHYNLGRVNGLKPITDIVTENRYKLFYNDLLLSSSYKVPLYTIKCNKENDKIKTAYKDNIKIGEDVLCPCCQKRLLTTSAVMVCDDCNQELKQYKNDDAYICYYCGKEIEKNNVSRAGDQGDLVCPDCAKKYTRICDRCGNRYHIDEMTWNHKEGKFLCDWCTMDLETERSSKLMQKTATSASNVANAFKDLCMRI